MSNEKKNDPMYINKEGEILRGEEANEELTKKDIEELRKDYSLLFRNDCSMTLRSTPLPETPKSSSNSIKKEDKETETSADNESGLNHHDVQDGSVSTETPPKPKNDGNEIRAMSLRRRKNTSQLIETKRKT